MLRKLKYFLLEHLGLPLGFVLFRVWHATLRVKYRNKHHLEEAYESRRGIIFGFWHGDLFATAYEGVRESLRRKIFILTSRSRDGEMLTRFLHRLHFGTVRGSSSRGGTGAFLALNDRLSEGMNTALALDGPRGPRHRVKPGAILLARTSGALILPSAIRYSRKIALKSWDRAEIPLPFSRCLILIGPPVTIPGKGSREELEQVRESLEKTLLELKGESNEK